MKVNLVDDFEVDIDMSPMIDMVFLLLIFFIVAAAMVEVKVPLTLPAASAAKTPEDVADRLAVSIDAGGQFYIGQAPISEEQLRARLIEEVKVNPNLRVFIRSDEMVPYRLNKKLMRICGDAGAINLIYAAFEE